MKKLILPLLLPLLLANLFFGYQLYCRETPQENRQMLQKLDLFLEVMQQVRENYVEQDEVDVDHLFDAAIKGMVYSLDPFSAFMTPTEFHQFEQEDSDTFGGVGVQIHIQEGVLTVSSVVRDTPAAQAGLLSGDQILTIDGQETRGKSLNEIVKLLRGEPGTTVTVGILRPGEDVAGGEPREVPLVRAAIENRSVNDVHMVAGTTTGFLRIDAFMAPTAKQFQESLKELMDQGMESLIIDLRGNPGGRVDISVDILSCLLPNDTMVASLEGRNPRLNSVYATHPAEYSLPPEVPVAVLGDRGTASAAEITISCLRDYHRAVFIGDRTFGKALVQDVMPLEGGNAVKFTVAKYYTRLRTPIQGKGIRPDIPDPLTREDYRKLFAPDRKEGDDSMDPNIQTALKFFADGAQWPVYEGKPEGDYEDILPQWQRENGFYNHMDDSMPMEEFTHEEQPSTTPGETPGETASPETTPAPEPEEPAAE